MGWLSVKDAARHLKKSTRTVRRMINAKTLASKLENGYRMVLIENHVQGPKNNLQTQESLSDRKQGERLTSRPESGSERLLSPLFDAYETLMDLALICRDSWEDFLFAERLRCFEEEDRLRERAFRKHIKDNVMKCLESLKSIIFEMRIQIPEYKPLLESIYTEMVETRMAWKVHISRLPDQIDVRNGKQLFDQIINDVKQALICKTERPNL